MSSKADYRTDLNAKLVGLEDSGYGDLEFTTAELDLYIELSVSQLYPAVYKRVSQDALTVVPYGTNYLASVTVSFPERVYLVEDAAELEPVTGWVPRPTKLIRLPSDITSVNVYYTDAYSLPVGDATDAGISNVYKPLIVTGALIEALESRHDTGVRGEPAPTGPYFQPSLIDRLRSHYETAKQELAMSLPGVTL